MALASAKRVGDLYAFSGTQFVLGDSKQRFNSFSFKSFCFREVEKTMYILATAVCLLGFASAQKVTLLNSCLSKENNLRMDCKYELTAASPVPTCTYTQENNVVGSTDPATSQDPTFKNRADVAIMEGSTTCRLILTGLSDDKPKNFTCTIKQKETVSKTSTVEKKLLQKCSAWSVHGSVLMLTMTSIVLLL
ncbi:hypothetical protein J4Q44_G00120210 [Coregonus suidteri]|uniref:Uncharacterized protein n=1 Tax=Coregonus suidteri TaxID=861788 RepID=A0AAN8MFU0_9TELE